MPLKMPRPQDISLPFLLGHLLLAWAVIILVARGLGPACRRFRQPAVLGEISGGILLGPSFLGAFFPEVKEFLFPPELLPWVNGISQLGIIFYMFLIGLELDWASLRRNGRSTLAISLASILFPFLLGLAFATWAETTLAGESANLAHYALFVGVSMSVTAFPVLARILSDTGLQQTPMGNLSLACAAINDAAAWCLLAVVIGLAEFKAAQGVQTLALVAVYLLIMFGAVRPLLKKTSALGIVVLLILLAVSASATAWIGIHAIFGAFLMGVVIPRDSVAEDKLAHRAEGWVREFLLPVFFTYTGLRTQINLLDSPHDWMLLAIVIILATMGKLGGTVAAARSCGLRWRPALTLGALMNTRGLVELIVLNAGYELNLISAKLFTMLVVMALCTTTMTCPLLQGLRRKETASIGAI